MSSHPDAANFFMMALSSSMFMPPFHSDFIGCSTLFRLAGLFVVMCCRAARPAVEPAGSGDASSGGRPQA